MEVINKQTSLSIMPLALAGFTLIEFIVVIMLSAILMTFAASRWSDTSNLNAQAQQLTADIQYTQSLAMTHAQRYRLTLIPPNSYAIATITGVTVPNAVTRNNVTTFDAGANFGSITGLPNNIIAFDGRGTPYINATATTALTSTATINLVEGSETRQIQINSNGKITVQ